jgi:serine/threonine-protein kinase
MRECPVCKRCFDETAKHCPHDGSRLRVAETLAGALLSSTYRLESLLGRGGMGEVYRATHVRIGKSYAVKLLRPEFNRDKEALARFEREAQTAGGLGHVNILDVVDFNQTEDGIYYIVTELLEGRSLGQAVAESGPLPAPRAIPIFHQICRALSVAHDHDIVHRDLKPENVFLIEAFDTEDFVKVLDFGISKVRKAESHLTQSGQIIGTPYFMSPEQAEGKLDLDHRSDIYSLGAMMYQVMTGRYAFDGETFQQVLLKLITEEPAPPRTHRPDLPPDMERIMVKAMARNPAERFQSMGEVDQALVAIWQQSYGSAAGGPNALPGSSAMAGLYRGGAAGPSPKSSAASAPAGATGPNLESSRPAAAPATGPNVSPPEGPPPAGGRPAEQPPVPVTVPVTEASGAKPGESSSKKTVALLVVALVVASIAGLGGALWLFLPGGEAEADRDDPPSDSGASMARRGPTMGAATTSPRGDRNGAGAGVKKRPRSENVRPPGAEGMVFIRGGKLMMGRNKGGRKYDRPAHEVFVADFYLDVTEVSNADYARYLKTKGRGTRPPWPGGAFPKGKERLPVTGVTWREADAYCRSVKGRRLPHEREWEYAARGGAGRTALYPWGSDFSADECVCSVESPQKLQPVESGSPRGAVHHLIGNAWEWTNTAYEPYPGSSAAPSTKTVFIIRGGGAESKNPEELTATYRAFDYPHRNEKGELATYPTLGFRCAMDGR